ncbi:MAG: TonB-dependent receptor plug domain-containing protein, partial [Candidatus Omnitrophica bacterium]|nr:TonB-dependent receptor plug domain-containing protein [Candidatus Omnitrophota bacterium]
MKRSVFVVAIFLLLNVFVGFSYGEEGSDVNLDKIVVTATRMDQEAGSASSNISVIDKDQIESSNAQYVSEILEGEAGIHYYDNSTAKTSTIDIRGFGDTAGRNVLLLVDGRKVNPVDISGPDWIQIPLESVEKIEIIRGAASVLYGDNASGGVVNIITKKGSGTLSGKAGVKYGSYGMHQENAEISGQQDKISYYLYSKYSNTDGYRSNSDLQAKDCNARLGYDISDAISLDLTAAWHKDDYGLPGGLDDQGELDQYGRR